MPQPDDRPDDRPGDGSAESLGQRIVRLREERGLTQRRLSQLTSLPLDLIADIEAGLGIAEDEYPAVVTIELLATALNVKPHSFQPWTAEDMADGLVVLDWPVGDVGLFVARRPGPHGTTQVVFVLTDFDRRRIQLVGDLPADEQTRMGLDMLAREAMRALAHAGQLGVDITGKIREPDDR
jgi:transcriptional regulator with XRE-family HTH domain